jgi:hypothetical protein
VAPRHCAEAAAKPPLLRRTNRIGHVATRPLQSVHPPTSQTSASATCYASALPEGQPFVASATRGPSRSSSRHSRSGFLTCARDPPGSTVHHEGWGRWPVLVLLTRHRMGPLRATGSPRATGVPRVLESPSILEETPSWRHRASAGGGGSTNRHAPWACHHQEVARVTASASHQMAAIVASFAARDRSAARRRNDHPVAGFDTLVPVTQRP